MKFFLEVQAGLPGDRYRLQKNGEWRAIENRARQQDYQNSPRDHVFDDLKTAVLHLPQNKPFELGGKSYTLNPKKTVMSFHEIAVESAYLYPRVARCSKPRRFTQQELEAVIASGNDELYNTLILTLDGHFRLIHPSERTEFSPIAVRHETFCAGNGYVGTKAAVDDRFIRETYFSTLESWIEHLRTGELDIYNDFYEGKRSEAELWREVDALTKHLV